jgi:hypothetical protein
MLAVAQWSLAYALRLTSPDLATEIFVEFNILFSPKRPEANIAVTMLARES